MFLGAPETQTRVEAPFNHSLAHFRFLPLSVRSIYCVPGWLPGFLGSLPLLQRLTRPTNHISPPPLCNLPPFVRPAPPRGGGGIAPQTCTIVSQCNSASARSAPCKIFFRAFGFLGQVTVTGLQGGGGVQGRVQVPPCGPIRSTNGTEAENVRERSLFNGGVWQ